jgi:ATP-dependent metalloprotease
MYLTSLVKTEQEGAVNTAVKKREALLASSGATAESSSLANESTAETQPTNLENEAIGPKKPISTPSSAQQPQSSVTESEQIAQNVLAGKHSAPKIIGNTHSEFATALEASQGKPIQVTIVERPFFQITQLQNMD